jgi:DNA-binding SARP family transcriptional activator
MSNAGAHPRRATLRLLGGFRLTGADGEPVAVASRRARGLLAYLALAPDRSATREKLCGLLWSDRAEPQARASLRQCLLELRDVMAEAGVDFVERQRNALALRSDAYGSDVDELRSALETSDVEALAEALVSLGSAPLLDDLEIPGLFHDWIEQARAQFDRFVGLSVSRRLERLEAERDWRSVSALADAYLHRDPLDEAVVAAAIRADIAMGATTTAHRRFQTLKSAMTKEFGVPPGPVTRGALALAPDLNPPEAGVREEPETAVISAPAAPRPVRLVVVAMFDTDEPANHASPLARHLREEVLSGLSRFTDLRVLSDPRPLNEVVSGEAGDRVGAYVLGASLRASRDGPRLNIQMLTTGEGRMVWSERFTPRATDGLDGMDDVIARVVGAVLPIILADMGRQSPPRDGYSVAHTMLTLGIDGRPQTFGEAQYAAETLEKMIRDDPSFEEPLLPLVYLYNTDFGHTRALSSGPGERARALELAKTALAMDRLNAHARIALGWCYLRQRQWDLARMHFDMALSLNPFHFRRLMEIDFAFILLDQLEQAQEILDRCLVINPTPHDDYYTDLGLLSLIRGDYDLAESYLKVGINPEIWCSVYTAINAQMAGRPAADDATNALSKVRAIWPETRALTPEAMVEWISQHHPFRSPEVERRFLAAALETFSDL